MCFDADSAPSCSWPPRSARRTPLWPRPRRRRRRLQPATPAKDEGIPVQSDLVRQRCGACHKERRAEAHVAHLLPPRHAGELGTHHQAHGDAAITRRSIPTTRGRFSNTSPDNQGLAPEEERPIAYEAERRNIDYTYAADKNTSDTCSSCHSMARVLERAPDEGRMGTAGRDAPRLLPARGQPADERRPRLPPDASDARPNRDPDGRPPDNRHPMEKSLEHLREDLPLTTPAWSAWSAAMQPPRLAGQWAVVGHASRQGSDLRPGDHHRRRQRRRQLHDSGSLHRGAQRRRRCRGRRRRSSTPAFSGRGARARQPTALARGDVRRARLERDVGTMVHRRLRRDRRGGPPGPPDRRAHRHRDERRVAAHRHLGAAVEDLRRQSPDRRCARRTSVSGRGEGRTRRQHHGLRKLRSKSTSPPPRRLMSATCRSRGRSSLEALVVYDKIDGLSVLPQAGMARVGGAVFPNSCSSSRRSASTTDRTASRDTADDLNLGSMDVKWSVEEYTATFGDDDLPVCRRDRRRRACSRRAWTVRTRSAPAIATTSATSGSSRSCRRRDARQRQAASRARAPAGDGAALHGVVRKRERAK
mgnify:CR=1 FL=1